MANSTYFTNIDKSKIEKLPFIKETKVVVYKDSANARPETGVLHLIDQASYIKLEARVKGIDTINLTSGQKVYIMPNCKIPQFKLREYFKTIGVSITNDHTKADAYIGANNACVQIESKAYTKGLNVIGGHANYAFYRSDVSKVQTYRNGVLTVDKYPYESDIELDYLNKILISRSMNLWSYDELVTTLFYITPLGAEIIYDILSNKKPVYSEDAIFRAIPSSVVLDQEMYESLNTMLNSSDEDSWNLAYQTIANCDFAESIVYLKKLYDDHYHKLLNNRFKNLKAFNAMYNMQKIYTMDNVEFFAYLVEEHKDKATKEMFHSMMSEEAGDIQRHFKNNIHLFDIVLIPKHKYADYHDGAQFKYEFD